MIPLFLLLISLGGVTYIAYRIVGFLGVAVLGVIIGMISLNVELERASVSTILAGSGSAPVTCLADLRGTITR